MDKGNVFSFYFSLTIIQILPCKEAPATRPSGLPHVVPQWGIQYWTRCFSLRYDFYKGTRRVKLLDSNEIRQLRDVCVFEINGMEMFM